MCLKKISRLWLRIYGKCTGENVQEYGYKQTHLFWLTLRQRSNGSQALDKESKEEMLLSSSLSSLNKTQFVSWGGCKRRDRKKVYFCSFIFCDYSNFLIHQMRVNFPRAAPLRSETNFRKRKKKLPWCFTSSTKHRIRIFRERSRSCTDDKEMYRKAWCLCRVVVVYLSNLQPLFWRSR